MCLEPHIYVEKSGWGRKGDNMSCRLKSAQRQAILLSVEDNSLLKSPRSKMCVIGDVMEDKKVWRLVMNACLGVVVRFCWRNKLNC